MANKKRLDKVGDNGRGSAFMKKLLTVLIFCMMLSCCNADSGEVSETSISVSEAAVSVSNAGETSAAGIDEVSDLVFNKGYGAEEVLKMVEGVYCEDMAERWGTPDGGLSGFWGDIWVIENGESKKRITVYYNTDGYAEHILIDDIEEQETNSDGETGSLQTDENGLYIDDDPPIYEEEWYLDDVLSLIGSKDEDYDSEAVLQMLTERDFHCDELHRHWGNPDGTLFGAWGDIWELENGKRITVYYNSDGYVENVLMDGGENSTEE